VPEEYADSWMETAPPPSRAALLSGTLPLTEIVHQIRITLEAEEYCFGRMAYYTNRLLENGTSPA
jgi:hypothetical protein